MSPNSEDITFHPVKVHTIGQSEGRLAFAGDRLVAVLVRLDNTHGELEGRWHAEAAFNSLERMEHMTFGSLAQAALWIKTRLDH